MIIKNAKVYTESGKFDQQDIFIEKERFTSRFIRKVDTIFDASGMYAIPGLTDIHFHGCAGYDYCYGTKEALQAIAHYEAQNGITTMCPATMTLPEEKLSALCRNAASYSSTEGAVFVGMNMEGPFLSAKKKGAQKEEYLLKPDLALFHRMDNLSGNKFRIVCIAPELEGAEELIKQLKDKKIISIAHTNANYETTRRAFYQGASLVTHLFNAMPPLHHREPGVIGAAFDSPCCKVELICDGIHLHPSVVRAVVKLFGDDRVIFVSDSMMATGLPDGSYFLGGQKVMVSGKKAELSDGTYAGSVTNLMDCMRNAVMTMGIPLETAIKAAAVNPAKIIGIYNDYGSITPGKVANLVLLDNDFQIKAVFLKGSRYR